MGIRSKNPTKHRVLNESLERHVIEYFARKTNRESLPMNEEVFNIQLRKFLKKVGIQSQREIEQAVRKGIETGSLDGTEILSAEMLLRVPAAGVEATIEDEIALT